MYTTWVCWAFGGRDARTELEDATWSRSMVFIEDGFAAGESVLETLLIGNDCSGFRAGLGNLKHLFTVSPSYRNGFSSILWI